MCGIGVSEKKQDLNSKAKKTGVLRGYLRNKISSKDLFEENSGSLEGDIKQLQINLKKSNKFISEKQPQELDELNQLMNSLSIGAWKEKEKTINKLWDIGNN